MTTLQKLFVGIPVGIGSLAIILLAGYLIYYYNFSKGGHLLKSRNSFESNRNSPVKHRANNFRFVSRTNSTEVMLQWKDLTDTRT